jgi:hypothetical protein
MGHSAEHDNRILLNNRIRTYMKEKIKDAFPTDYKLVEDIVDDMIAQYTLKELILLLNIEIEKRKENKGIS